MVAATITGVHVDSLLNIARWLDRLGRLMGQWAGWIILPLIFVIMFDVITRKIDLTRLYFSDFTIEYGYSVSTILQDLQWHFHALLLMFSFGFGYLANAHVRVDIFREMLSRRKQGWFEFIGLIVLGLPFLTIMIIYSWDMVSLSYSQGEGSDSMTGIGMRWIPKSFMIIGFVVAMGAVIATLIRLAAMLFGTQEQGEVAVNELEIFSDQSTALEEARRAAEAALAAEREAAQRPAGD